MIIIFYTRNVNYLKPYSVLAETFYPGFITFYAYAPCIYIMDFYGLLLIFFYAALVNTTHGFLLEMGCSTFQINGMVILRN